MLSSANDLVAKDTQHAYIRGDRTLNISEHLVEMSLIGGILAPKRVDSHRASSNKISRRSPTVWLLTCDLAP